MEAGKKAAARQAVDAFVKVNICDRLSLRYSEKMENTI